MNFLVLLLFNHFLFQKKKFLKSEMSPCVNNIKIFDEHK